LYCILLISYLLTTANFMISHWEMVSNSIDLESSRRSR